MSHLDPSDEQQIDAWIDELERRNSSGESVKPEVVCDRPSLLADLQQRYARLLEVNAMLDVQQTRDEETETHTDVDFDAAPSTKIGPYKLLQKIGEGGMGEVWMAEQTQPIRRNVALKLVRSSFSGKKVLARFEAERQALALMDHQNIASVFDAGATSSGAPYFVMELVRGKSITNYCDEHNMPVAMRMKLFAQACRAIQHSHQKGVIHRDIKPSNVLVTEYDGEPCVKVIDFGLAKALDRSNLLTEETLFTEFGQVVGTMQYMSPEQTSMNALDTDTRSDVYSLGVLLYELLTGSTPLDRESFRKRAFDQVLTAIREEEPPRPSQRLSSIGHSQPEIAEHRGTDLRKLGIQLSGDLDWITMKSLEKERWRRYDTPAQFADDIQRYLDDEPVVARPPSIAYQFTKSFQRHRSAYAITAVLLVSLIIGGGFSTWQWARARTTAEENRQLAVNNANLLQRATDSFELALKREQDAISAAAEQKRAREEVETRVAELYSLQGLAAGEKGFDAEASLWFAAAMEQTLDHNRHEALANLVRYLFSSKNQPTPIEAFRSTALPTRIDFDENDRYFMVQFSDKTALVGDCRGEMPTSLRSGCVALGPRGDLIAIGGQGGVSLYSLPTFEQIHHCETSDRVSHLAFSASGHLLAVGGKRIVVLRTDDFIQLKGSVVPEADLNSLGFSLEQDRLIFSTANDVANIHRIENEELRTVPEREPFRHEFNNFIAEGSDLAPLPVAESGLLLRKNNRTVQWLDMDSGQTIKEIVLPRTHITKYRSTYDGTKFAVCGWRTCIAFDAVMGEPLSEPLIFKKNIALRDAMFADNDSTLIVLGNDAWTRRWSPQNADAPADLWLRHPEKPKQGKCSRSGRYAVTCQEDGLVCLWSMPNTQDETSVPMVDHRNDSYRFELSDDEKHFITVGTWDRMGMDSLQVRAIQTGNIEFQYEPNGSVNAAAFSANGLLAAGITDGRTNPSSLNGFQASSVTSFPGEVRVWDWTSNTLAFPKLETPSVPVDCCFSADGALLGVMCAEGEILVVNTTTGRVISTAKHEGAREVWYFYPERWIRFLPNSDRLVTSGFGQAICIWDPWSGTRLYRYDHRAAVLSYNCSSSGRFLAMGTDQGEVRVADLSNGDYVGEILPHPGRVMSLEFGPDENLLLTASVTTTRLWDWRTGRITSRPFRSEEEVTQVKMSPLGNWAFTATKSRLHIWDSNTGIPLIGSLPSNNSSRNLRFQQGGRKGLTLSSDEREVRVFSLAPLAEPPIDGRALQVNRLTAELRSAAEILESGINPLTTEDWIARWDRLNELTLVFDEP